jgi:hypothetical protein
MQEKLQYIFMEVFRKDAKKHPCRTYRTITVYKLETVHLQLILTFK